MDCEKGNQMRRLTRDECERLRRLPDGFEVDMGSYKAEFFSKEVKEERRMRWKALRALFTPARMERGFCSNWWEAYARLVCAVALITGRMRHLCDGTESHEYETIASWDVQNEYAGWSGMFVSVNIRAWRAEVYRDGDWNM